MKFVARRKDRTNYENCAEQQRHFRAQSRTATKGPPQKKRQNRVLGEMRAFAHNDKDGPDCLRGHPWFQPEQEWRDESRRVLGGHYIGGADEDYAQPNEQRQPIFEERFHPEVRRPKSEISTETPNIQHRTLNVQWQKDSGKRF